METSVLLYYKFYLLRFFLISSLDVHGVYMYDLYIQLLLYWLATDRWPIHSGTVQRHLFNILSSSPGHLKASLTGHFQR